MLIDFAETSFEDLALQQNVEVNGRKRIGRRRYLYTT